MNLDILFLGNIKNAFGQKQTVKSQKRAYGTRAKGKQADKNEYVLISKQKSLNCIIKFFGLKSKKGKYLN